ncbi:hypothetical protein [Arthrospiribacter ruber]|uniref:Uncharacterized protein n=1 Tax=Arthrospiribacter ruber TaxID=2487934 RepID=A0A951IRV5_9BACT|nr:hypothetical protein [Arthrospiribacter ruber]MBW3466620.1 hypothetical protein [Arthrospiribacter ruber]
MKQYAFTMILIVILIGCDQKGELSQGNWIITEGTYKGQKIHFLSTGLIQFRDAEGNINANLKFFKGGRITLPGINSADIRGRWNVIDKKLYLSIDTAKYDFIYKTHEKPQSLSSLIENNIQQKRYLDSLEKVDSINLINWQKKNPLLSNEFRDVMKVYSNPFEITIKGDVLMLESNTTTLKAFKDRSIEKMFEGI